MKIRCYICDKALTDKEGAYNKELGQREPCSNCLDIALDAAYADGFQQDDDEYVLIIGEDTGEDSVDVVRYSEVRMYHSIDGDDE